MAATALRIEVVAPKGRSYIFYWHLYKRRLGPESKRIAVGVDWRQLGARKALRLFFAHHR